MSEEILLQLAYEALLLVASVVAPPILAALTTGLLVGLAQAITQVQDQALSLAFRIAAVFGALVLSGQWAFDRIACFAGRVLEMVAFA